MARRGRGEGSIFRRKDGRWVAELSWPEDDGTRTREYLYASSQAEAQRRLRDRLNEAELGLPAPAERETLKVYLEGWLRRVEGRVEGKTARLYRSRLERYVVPVIGRYKLAKLRPEHVENVLQRAHDAGLDNTTVNHLHGHLRQALQDAVRTERLGRNVADLVKPPRLNPPKQAPLSKEQAIRLFMAARDEPLGALFILAMLTAMRQGELLALAWRDIDLDRGLMSVVTNVQRQRGLGLRPKDPKSRSGRRQIALPAVAVEVLWRQRARVDESRIEAGTMWDDHDLVFPNAFGRYREGQNITRRQWHPLLERLGLPKIRFHDLRHTTATLLALEGVNPKEVADLLGHSSPNITIARYTQIASASHGNAARAIDSIFGPRDQTAGSGRKAKRSTP